MRDAVKGIIRSSLAAGVAVSLFFIRAGWTVAGEASEPTAAEFFVAVEGKDHWSGRLAKPNRAQTDGPFATLARARDAVRESKRGASGTNLIVRIRGGTYSLKETLIFSLADAAPAGGTITYAAYRNETPVITSGVPIKNWRRLVEDPPNLPANARGKIWVADLPPELENILTLYDSEGRLPRARGDGFAPTEAADKRTWPDRISFPAGALRNWTDLNGAELLIIPTADYEMSILPLASVDEANGIARTAFAASRPIGKVKFFPISAWVENVLEVLDQPGEWVFDSRERKVYLWPRRRKPGDRIVAPRLTELLRVEGKIDYDGPRDKSVRGLVFRGLTFQHTERFQSQGHTGWRLQHHWEMFDRPTAAVRFRGAENCAVEGCRFTALSGTAIRLDLHSQQNRIVDNEISHVGGVGVLLAGYGPGTKDVNRQNIVRNNWIHHTGEIYWATPAVMVWQSGENHVANNLIHDTPYSAMTISTRAGWNRAKPESDRTVRWKELDTLPASLTWQEREPFMHARKNVVERNDIHDIMQVMGDGDGVYISGTGGGNLIRQNFIHDCDSDGMADGVRCDDDQHGTTIESNIIYRSRCIGQGICSKGVNHIINNIIADLLPSRRPIRPERVVRGYIGLEVNPVTGSRIERNIVVSRHGDYPAMIQDRRYGAGGEPRLRECKADFNLYHCFEDAAWGRKHLEKEQPFGVETHSVATDPLFVSFEKGDLRFKPQSPALKLGFQPIDVSQIGLLPNHPYHRR